MLGTNGVVDGLIGNAQKKHKYGDHKDECESIWKIVESIRKFGVTSEDKNFKSIKFNHLNKSEEELVAYSYLIFTSSPNVVEERMIDKDKFMNLLIEIKYGYRQNQYHNFHHAFAVFQMCYIFSNQIDLPSKIGISSYFVMLLACIGHDLDHPGMANATLVKLRHPLAVQFNLKSPNEQNHISKLCHLIFENQNTNIFGDLSAEKKNIIHKTLNFLILSTDMDLHKDRIDQLLEIKTTDVNSEKIASEYVDTISMALIKLCDLSNEFRPFKIFKEIHASLIEEFRQQANLESRYKIDLTLNVDKIPIVDLEKFFISKSIEPLLDGLLRFFPALGVHKVRMWANFKKFEAYYTEER